MEPEVGVQRQIAVGTSPRPGGVSVSAGPGGSPSDIDLRDEPEPRAEGAPGAGPGRLDQLVKALLRAVSLSDIAAAVVAYGTAAAGARWARAVLLDREGAVAVSLLGGQAVPSRRFESAGFEVRCPWIDAVREGATLMFPSAEDLRRAYPGMDEVYSLPSEGAVITVPLGPAGDRCGAVTFGFDERGPIADPVRATVATVASLAASAAPRAVVYETEYRAAELLQQAYLPGHLPDVAGLTFASRCLSAGEPWGVAGDWYDALALPGPYVGLVMGDVAGHGIQAATVMAALRGAVRAFSTVDASPAAILARMNTYLGVFKPDAFATLFVALFDPAAGRLRYARAGHPPALLLRPDGSSDLLHEPVGPPLGLPGTRYREGEQPFPPGSTLVIYTDGLIERQDRDIDLSMADLVRTASSHHRGSPEDLCDRLVELLAGAELFDDATLLVVMRDGGARACPPAP
jgi:hypothetical protein